MKKKLEVIIALLLMAAVISACGMFASGGEADASKQNQPTGRVVADEEPAEEDVYLEEEPMAEEESAGVAAAPLPTQAALPAVPAETLAEGEDAPPPDTMLFEDYGTNPFVSTDADNLSTFAVDVDTGSYTVTRSYINDGWLPPAEAVRLEEFVNYFEQDYPVPQQDAFSINLDAAPTPFSVEGNVVLRVGIQGYEVPADQRPDATLIFVVDVSGSMDQQNRLGAVKRALSTLVDELRPTDKIGIVIYGSNGQVLLEPTPVAEREAILAGIERLQPGGSTNAEEGLLLAYQMATANFEEGRINRLILCSDGVANVGETGPDAILETVRQQAREGVTLTTVGFGLGNYNDVLMEQLADDGDGQYYYVDTQNEAERIFVHGLTGTLLTIAKDAKIQVEFNPAAVTHYRLMGYENRDVADEDFRNDSVDAGEIGAGHRVTALYELVLAEQPQGELATVRLRWADPDDGSVTEIAQGIDVDEINASFEDASPRFRLDVAVAAFADWLSGGAWGQTVDIEYLQQLATQLANELGNDPDVAEFAGLVEQAPQLEQ